MNFVPEVIGRTIARNALLAQKASPEVLLGAGIVGMVGSTVLACRATLKMESILDEAKKKLDMAKTVELSILMSTVKRIVRGIFHSSIFRLV